MYPLTYDPLDGFSVLFGDNYISLGGENYSTGKFVVDVLNLSGVTTVDGSFFWTAAMTSTIAKMRPRMCRARHVLRWARTSKSGIRVRTLSSVNIRGSITD